MPDKNETQQPIEGGSSPLAGSPSSTPETDEAQRLGNVQNQADPDQSWPWDAIKRGYDHARKLERERNAIATAARAIIEAWDEDEIGQIDGGLIDALREFIPENVTVEGPPTQISTEA